MWWLSRENLKFKILKVFGLKFTKIQICLKDQMKEEPIISINKLLLLLSRSSCLFVAQNCFIVIL